jgi:hypothetical protein
MVTVLDLEGTQTTNSATLAVIGCQLLCWLRLGRGRAGRGGIVVVSPCQFSVGRGAINSGEETFDSVPGISISCEGTVSDSVSLGVMGSHTVGRCQVPPCPHPCQFLNHLRRVYLIRVCLLISTDILILDNHIIFYPQCQQLCFRSSLLKSNSPLPDPMRL